MSEHLYSANQLEITYQILLLQYKYLTIIRYVIQEEIKIYLNGSDIYHLILQALVYNLSLVRLHSVRSATSKTKRKDNFI